MARDLVSKLRAVCHTKECKKIDECPLTHPRCKVKLDVQTAVAWVLAEMILGEKGIYKKPWSNSQLRAATHLAFQALSQHEKRKGFRGDVASTVDFVDFVFKYGR